MKASMVMAETECASSRPDVTESELDLIKRLCVPLKITAAELETNYNTVRIRVKRLQDKFGVENMRALIIKAIKLGFLTVGDFKYREYRDNG